MAPVVPGLDPGVTHVPDCIGTWCIWLHGLETM